MGCFTWTFANRKVKVRRDGFYSRSCLLEYGSRGYVCCPDGSFIREEYYDGYGIFQGHDVFELVAEWNKNYLKDIYKNMPIKTSDYPKTVLLAEAYQDGDFEKLGTLASQMSPYYVSDWKRVLGIEISCYERNNAVLPYPLKITSTDKLKLPYAELPHSIQCQ